MKRVLLLVVLSGFFLPAFSKQDTTYAKRIYTTSGQVSTLLAIAQRLAGAAEVVLRKLRRSR